MTPLVDDDLRLAQWIDPQGPPADANAELPSRAHAIVAAARQHRVAGLLARALDAQEAIQQLGQARETLRRAVIDERTMHVRHAAFGRFASEALAAAGIPALLLKGAALGPLVYPDPALRPMTDIDLLVPQQARSTALETLAHAGFERPSFAVEAFWSEAYYNLPLTHPQFPTLMLELHWSIAQAGRHVPDLDGLFQRAQVLPDGSSALGPEDLLLHQTLHHSYHYFEPRLIWIYDLALLHRRRHDAKAVIARAESWGMRVPLALSIHQMDRVFPGSTQPIYRDFAAHNLRSRWLMNRFPARSSLELLGGWERRSRQLVAGLLMLDRPTQMLTQLCGWIWRTLRFGDRAGRTIGKEQAR